jgi:TolA-binding protein
MKTAIIIIIAALVILGAGYVGVPFLIDRHTLQLKNEVQDLKQRLQKMEDEAKAAPLQPDADGRQIIKTVNAVSLKLNTMENSFKKDISSAEESIKKQQASTEDALKKQAEIIEKNQKETQSRMQLVKFDSAVADIREHILKARIEIIARNIGNAKTELDFIDDLFSAAIAFLPEENKKTMSELQTSVKKAKSEIDADLPSAVNRINILWHEMSRLLRKG